MKIRSVALSVLGVAVAAAATVLPANTAHAGGGCTFIPPSRIVVASESQIVHFRYGSNCAAAGTSDASWTAIVGTRDADFQYYPNSSEIFYDFNPLGIWTWRPDGATDRNYESAAQNTPHSIVRLGSKAYLRVSRSGSRVTVWTRDSRYFNDYTRAWNYYAGWHGQIQWRYVGYQTWHALKDTHQNSVGVYSYSYTQPAAREYRVVFPDNSAVWGSTSPTVRG